MILVNQFDMRYDGTPLSVCRTTRVAVNEKKISYIYKRQSGYEEDNGMIYSVICFDDGTDIMCKDCFDELEGFVRFKHEYSDTSINKDKVKMLQDYGWRTVVLFNKEDYLSIYDKFDEVMERLR